MCDECDFDKYLEKTENMMEDSSYDFALETIEGVHDWIEKNNHVTEKQKETINNIEESIYE